MIPQIPESSLVHRKLPVNGKQSYIPYSTEDGLVPPMAIAGQGYYFHLTGLTHDERGYPTMTAAAQDRLATRLVDKIRLNVDDIVTYEEFMTDDAEIVVVAYGITSRIARFAVKLAREQGIKAGLLQLVTLWPFAEKRVRELASRTKRFVVAEINRGQMVYEVERCACGKAATVLVPHSGGDVHRPEAIMAALRESR